MGINKMTQMSENLKWGYTAAVLFFIGLGIGLTIGLTIGDVQ